MKKSKYSCILTLVFLLYSFAVSGQDESISFVVEYHGKDVQKLMQKISSEFSGRNAAIPTIHPFTSNKGNVYYSLQIPVMDAPWWKSKLLEEKEVIYVEENTQVETRNTRPNDPRLNEQWYLENINAFEAWSVTKGGLNSDGKEVVIAVIDDGFEIGHEDFKGIFFINQTEVANDGIDNDGNGYADDYSGYNFVTNNGKLTSERHGTNVLGVLGARGNNNVGISGINWDIKVLPLVIPATSTGVERALDYVLAMRKLYDATQGQKGAYIVAVTYSGGISKRFASEFPIWCGLYDKLGQVGVLSVGATTNNNDNVDVVGDIPSTCTSNFLIVVTNSNELDVKAREAGYGKQHVDMAVPGEDILTTNNAASKYGYENGTSLSAPIMAGAISLLHTVDCKSFQNQYKNSPALSTLDLKDIILISGDPAFYQKSGTNAPLAEITSTGRRLNIYNALDTLQTRFGGCIPNFTPPGPLSIGIIKIIGDHATIEYNAPTNDEISVVVFDVLGRVIYNTKILPDINGEKSWILNLDALGKGSNQVPGMVYFVGLIQGKSKVGKSFYIFR